MGAIGGYLAEIVGLFVAAVSAPIGQAVGHPLTTGEQGALTTVGVLVLLAGYGVASRTVHRWIERKGGK